MNLSQYKFQLLLFLIIIIGWSSCKTGREYQRPALNLPSHFETVNTADTSSIADVKWEIFFKDTTLQRLISEGVSYNYDLQIALKRIAAAQAQVRQSGQLGLPELNLGVSAQTSRPSDNSLNGLSAGSLLQTHHIEDYNAGLTLSWEADIWGKIRRQKEAAVASYLQTFEAARAVQTRLVADIAFAYYNLLMLDEQMNIARENLALNDSTLQLTRLQQQAGEVTILAVQQAESQRQSTAGFIPQLELDISIQEHALSILTGQLPGKIMRSASLSRLKISDNLSSGVPAAMVSRRPDVRASEMSLVAANAEAGVAQANLYPALNITAGGGINSFKASNWFNIPGSLFGLVAGSIAQPVFQHRQLKTQLEVAGIHREEAVIVFRQSVLNAVGEVSDALVKINKLKAVQELTATRVHTLQQAISNAHLLFRSGMASYLEVITAQQNALQAELSLADIKRQRLNAAVELYRSLGGGWK